MFIIFQGLRPLPTACLSLGIGRMFSSGFHIALSLGIGRMFSSGFHIAQLAYRHSCSQMHVCASHLRDQCMCGSCDSRPTGPTSRVALSGGRTTTSSNDEAGCIACRSVGHCTSTIPITHHDIPSARNRIHTCTRHWCAYKQHPPHRPCRVPLHQNEGPRALVLFASEEDEQGLAATIATAGGV